MDRHARQAKLAEVGPAGQARIASAVVDIPLGGFAAEVAARYLAGAGVAAVRVRDRRLAGGASSLAPAVRVEVDPALPEGAGEGRAAEHAPEVFLLRDPVARDLARGALVALDALRAVLRGGAA